MPNVVTGAFCHVSGACSRGAADFFSNPRPLRSLPEGPRSALPAEDGRHGQLERNDRQNSRRQGGAGGDGPDHGSRHRAAPRGGPRTIAVVERRIRHPLPPSYRAFLHLHDGWPLFFHEASLLGTRDLSKPGPFHLTRAAFAAYETPIPEIGPPSRPQGDAQWMIPFGIDPAATTIFAFNPAVKSSSDGEMEVIMWVNGLGERVQNFAEFLVASRWRCSSSVWRASGSS